MSLRSAALGTHLAPQDLPVLTMHLRNPITVSSIACLLLGACAEEPPAPVEERALVIGFGYCPPELCGSNSDVGGAFSFDTRSVTPNANMILAQAIDPEGGDSVIRVMRDSIELQTGDSEPYAGVDLIGSQLVFDHVEGGQLTGQRTIVYIEDFVAEAVPVFTESGTRYSTYRFSFRDADEPEDVRHPLCSAYPWPDSFGLGQLDSTMGIMIQSESYDWQGHAIPDVADPFDWATLGCLGGAYAKKVLMGYDPHHPGPEATTLAENETMMRMLTARYCEGENHTEPGTPLYWQNDRGWYSLPEDQAIELEALWTADGVACLDTPRLVARELVEADCGPIPTCAGFDPADYHLASYRVLD